MAMVAVLTAPLWLSAAADASCAAPEIDIGRQFEVVPGDDLVIRGRFWTDTCDDTGGGSPCSQDGFERGDPVQDIRLMLVPKGDHDDEGVFLAEVDADDNFGFRTEVEVPDVEPGRYVIVDASGQGYFAGNSFRVKRP